MVLVQDRFFGAAQPFHLRFVDALGIGAVLSQQHGGLGIPAVHPPTLSDTRATGLAPQAPGVCFTRTAVALHAWRSKHADAPRVTLGTVPAQVKPQASRGEETVDVGSCPPHCPIANLELNNTAVASWPWKRGTAVLVNSSGSKAATLRIVPDDLAPAPHLAHARFRIVSFVPGRDVAVSATPQFDAAPVAFRRLRVNYGEASASQELLSGAYTVGVALDGVSIDASGSAPAPYQLSPGRCYTLYVLAPTVGSGSASMYSARLEEDADFYGLARVRIRHVSPSGGQVAARLAYAEHSVRPANLTPYNTAAIGYGGSTTTLQIPVSNRSTYTVRVPGTNELRITVGDSENWTVFIVPSQLSGGSYSSELWAVQDTLNAAAESAAASTLTGQLQAGLRWLNVLPAGRNGSRAWQGQSCSPDLKQCREQHMTAFGETGAAYALSRLYSVVGIPESWMVVAKAEKQRGSTAAADSVHKPLPLESGSLSTVVLTGATPATPELLLFEDSAGQKPSFYERWKWALAAGLGGCALLACAVCARRTWVRRAKRRRGKPAGRRGLATIDVRRTIQ